MNQASGFFEDKLRQMNAENKQVSLSAAQNIETFLKTRLQTANSLFREEIQNVVVISGVIAPLSITFLSQTNAVSVWIPAIVTSFFFFLGTILLSVGFWYQSSESFFKRSILLNAFSNAFFSASNIANNNFSNVQAETDAHLQIWDEYGEIQRSLKEELLETQQLNRSFRRWILGFFFFGICFLVLSILVPLAQGLIEPVGRFILVFRPH